MRRYRAVVRLSIVACLFVTASLSTRTVRPSRAAPSDFLDVPGSLAANADGDVYVSFATDTATSVMRRFSADGAVLAHWEVTRGDIVHYAIAEGADGGVYVAIRDHGLVRHYSKDGQQTAEWPVAGLKNAIAAAPGGGAADSGVYVVTSVLGGGAAVLEYDPAGSLRASFPADRSTYDLAVWPPGGADEASVAVAEAARNQYTGAFVSRYSLAGTWLDGWGEDGAIAGMDVDDATEALWLGVTDPVTTTRFFHAVNRDRTRVRKCDLPAYPIDLTVGEGGDLFVLAYEDPDQDMVREVLRYRPDCTLVDTWDLERLNGFVRPTPTGPTGAPSDTPTATPSGSETPTTTLVTATATNAPSGTITPTAVLHPWQLWLPIAWRNGT